MTTAQRSPSAEIRARLDHPVIDVDGHFQEVQPVVNEYFLEYARETGGSRLLERFRTAGELTFHQVMAQWQAMTPEERQDNWATCPPWWGQPTRNTLDRATTYLPRLLYERMDDLGIDFSVLYPSFGLTLVHLPDAELRHVACRAYNRLNADLFRPFGDRMTPAAVIPMDTPAEAIDELEHVVKVLGLKAIVIAQVYRAIPSLQKAHPEVAGLAPRLDWFGIDSPYEYDPFWAKCVELKVAVGMHGAGQGWGSRRSPSRYVYNHIGSFAAADEALCKAIFLGGVTRRFPTLKFAFLEGGAGWACTLYADLIAHWEKRSPMGLELLNPAHLDQARLLELFARYADDRVTARLEAVRGWFAADQPRPAELDDFAACRIGKAEDIKDLFVPNFYFGCEADDPINAWAFNTKINPFGARLKVILGSDISHWDVTDMAEVLEEAHELVDRDLMTPADFREFVFVNPSTLYAESNPDFFKGTRVEAAVTELLAARSLSPLPEGEGIRRQIPGGNS
jgi:predicted TIM-barrel fold metal-dependent hydrolase